MTDKDELERQQIEKNNKKNYKIIMASKDFGFFLTAQLLLTIKVTNFLIQAARWQERCEADEKIVNSYSYYLKLEALYTFSEIWDVIRPKIN